MSVQKVVLRTSVSPMILSEATKIVGNQSKYHLQMMVKALKLCPWMNTEEDNKRLRAAQIVIKAMGNGSYRWPAQ